MTGQPENFPNDNPGGDYETSPEELRENFKMILGSLGVGLTVATSYSLRPDANTMRASTEQSQPSPAETSCWKDNATDVGVFIGLYTMTTIGVLVASRAIKDMFSR